MKSSIIRMKNSRSEIRLVIFDLDNTLYAEKDYFRLVFEVFEEAAGLPTGKLLAAYESVNRCESKDILGDCLSASHGNTERHKDQLFDIYKSVRGELPLPEQSRALLTRCADQHIHLALLSNGIPVVQRNKVALLKVKPFFDRCFFARENPTGLEKPSTGAFAEVLDYFQLDARQAMMVGDDLVNDVFGARLAGLNTFHLDMSDGYDPSKLNEFLLF